MKKFIYLMLVCGLFGCASSPKDVSAPIGKALVVIYNDSAANVLLPLATTKSGRIESLNGNPISDFWNSVKYLELEPGEHTLEISCRILRGGLDVSGLEIKKLNVVEGAVYKYTPQFGVSNSCILVQS